jgi:hypothetical protein
VAGDALLQGRPAELAPGNRIPMRVDFELDLASLTRAYTAILVLQLVDRGAGGPAEVLAPGVVMAVAGMAPLAATLALWRMLADF